MWGISEQILLVYLIKCIQNKIIASVLFEQNADAIFFGAH